MIDPIRELKVRAERLHRSVQASETTALIRLRALPELRQADAPALKEAAAAIQRKHCLAVVGKEAGFGSWDHARRVLEGDEAEVDFGKLLYGDGRGAYLNHWFVGYDEARVVHAKLLEEGLSRFLLAYQRQLFITEAGYVESIGLDAADPDWHAIGWDWARPRSFAARRRLYAKLLQAQRAANG